MTRRLGPALGAVLVLGLLAGCGSGARTSGTPQSEYDLSAPAPADNSGGGTPGKRGAGESAGIAPNAPIPPDQKPEPVAPNSISPQRQLIRTARLELKAADVAEAVGRGKDAATRAGGFAGAEETRESRATLTLRVPSDKLDPVLEELAKLGEVTVRDVRSTDVTDQLVDTQSRIASQKASVERVRALLERANTVGEVVQVEGELTRRQAELESLQKRLESMSNQVAMSTVTLAVTRTGAPPPKADSGFLSGLASGWNALLAFGSALLTGIGAVLPFAVLLAIPVLALVIWLRRRKPAAVPGGPVAAEE
ncbi:DUF4349 domain-containing protein [Allokutzneria sp. A3M-2-11 16]|uniref:DUF4349 domain-containing protein n=1 Tax=Allokutzneria sp. A3M-2-11 16 TaxID=2962043 RepID=UPI0020B6D901|nr:DUF4349 domain-containing protein [Allokutzneria sp. A3M-2-11 16]MCP3799030.1 DUF4349 domain-containing protein [Allokutzneria sp. A3M-2-11 16]